MSGWREATSVVSPRSLDQVVKLGLDDLYLLVLHRDSAMAAGMPRERAVGVREAEASSGHRR